MSGFKVGDRVRALETSPANQITEGEVYTVAAVSRCDESGDPMVTLLAGKAHAIYASRFELVSPEPEFKKGDRVRVTTEVEVLDDRLLKLPAFGGTQLYGYRAKFNGLDVVIPESATIEKIEPPVEVFGAGDVVRHKSGGSPFLLLAGNRYVYVESGGDGHVFDDAPEWFEKYMNSKYYERVTLVEPPL